MGCENEVVQPAPRGARAWHVPGFNLRHLQNFSVGQKLWVKETFKVNEPPSGWIYRATDEAKLDPRDKRPWKPSIFMPRRASRITLEIESIRAERVQEISEQDAIAEGVESWIAVREPGFMRCRGIHNDNYHRRQYEDLWESINGKGSWARSPWVWVIAFRQIGNEEGSK